MSEKKLKLAEYLQSLKDLSFTRKKAIDQKKDMIINKYLLQLSISEDILNEIDDLSEDSLTRLDSVASQLSAQYVCLMTSPTLTPIKPFAIFFSYF